MSTPSPSPSPPPPSSPPSNPAAKTPKPLPWTHQETVLLIQAYQDKWYSLKRGQLKSTQWEQVATTIAAHCGFHHHQPPKTAIQCRHKMEKLRRRYREEKKRISSGGRCSWQYFTLMDSLECGPQPIAARPLNLIPPRGITNDDDDEEDEEEEEEEDYGYRSKSQSIDYILRKPAMVNRFAGSRPGFSISAQEEEAVRKRKREAATEAAGGLELAEEIKGFGERMMWMERKKMEMVKEMEGWRMDMEKKRMEMIMESQRKIVGMIASAFASSHNNKDSNLEQQQQQL